VPKLKGRVAVVTGAASGIGRATSVLLAQRGCSLALGDIDGVGLAETARLAAGASRTITTHEVDVASRDAMRKFAEDVVGAHGAVHVLVNNAGVGRGLRSDLGDHAASTCAV
jgi:NAD(P)-dependent dehydrogenase (short-subunit alcohol dehydrogenase family)